MPNTAAAGDSTADAIQPLLTSVFFDSASAVIPSRYHLFASPTETVGFVDTASSAGALTSCYNLLNIIGSAILCYIAFFPFKVGFVVLEGTWVLISIYAMIRNRRERA